MGGSDIRTSASISLNTKTTAYQSYLRQLLAAAGGPGAPASRGGGLDGRTAVRCLCGLLEALPHFNYRSDLLSALVPRLGSADTSVAACVRGCVEALLREGRHPEAVLEAVQLLADHIKSSSCRAPPWTLDALAALRFDEGMAARLRAERDVAAGKPATQKDRNRAWIEQRRKLRDDAKRGARAAPTAEAEPGEGGLDERSLRDLDVAPDTAALAVLQTRTLEALCEIYFRVLKAAVAAPGPAEAPLLGAALAGVARVAPLIDFDVVADILRLLTALLAGGGLAAHARARCVLASCDVLSGHGGALLVDTRDLHRHTYSLALHPPSLCPSQDWAEPGGGGGAGLWARCLGALLLSRSHRQVDTPRLAAFAKRLAAVALVAEPGEACAALGVVRELLARHPRLRRLLENEPGAPTAHAPDAPEPEAANALSACLWELALAAGGAHPAVAALAHHIAAMPVDAAPLPPPTGLATPEELAATYGTRAGRIVPTVPPRSARAPHRAVGSGGGARARALVADLLQEPRAVWPDAEGAKFLRDGVAYEANARARMEARTLAGQVAAWRRFAGGGG